MQSFGWSGVQKRGVVLLGVGQDDRISEIVNYLCHVITDAKWDK